MVVLGGGAVSYERGTAGGHDVFDLQEAAATQPRVPPRKKLISEMKPIEEMSQRFSQNWCRRTRGGGARPLLPLLP